MLTISLPKTVLTISLLSFPTACQLSHAQSTPFSWSFAVSGDSRDCGDFVLPAISTHVKAEKDDFYWHLGDFRKIQEPDQDLVAMNGGKVPPLDEYIKMAWDDFLAHQIGAFGTFPVFLGRGNHETLGGLTREDYIKKFYPILNRPEIVAQRQADKAAKVDVAPVGPWYHWTYRGIDFITMDNSDADEFTLDQLHWLRSVLDHDLLPNSGITTIVMAAHEALPHSTGVLHAMDDWAIGEQTGNIVYQWFYDAESAGKHVYLIASHSHYYMPNIYRTIYWYQYSSRFVPGIIIGSAGAHRYPLPQGADDNSKTMIYGYLQGYVASDGSIDFKLHELSEQDLLNSKWPTAPADAIHECFVHNGG
jgi:hypothetical protein